VPDTFLRRTSICQSTLRLVPSTEVSCKTHRSDQPRPSPIYKSSYPITAIWWHKLEHYFVVYGCWCRCSFHSKLARCHSFTAIVYAITKLRQDDLGNVTLPTARSLLPALSRSSSFTANSTSSHTQKSPSTKQLHDHVSQTKSIRSSSRGASDDLPSYRCRRNNIRLFRPLPVLQTALQRSIRRSGKARAATPGIYWGHLANNLPTSNPSYSSSESPSSHNARIHSTMGVVIR
jgi:hypothetical protein